MGPLTTFHSYLSHVLGFPCKLLFEEEFCWLRKGRRLAHSYTAQAGETKAKKDQGCEVRVRLELLEENLKQ